MDFDSKILLHIFPEEIWNLIIDKVTDMKGLMNLSNSAAFFYKRLMFRQTMFLFPEVFEVLIEQNQLNDQRFTKQKHLSIRADNMDIRHTKFPWNLRLVCSDWNKAIEDYFQKSRIHQNFMKSCDIHLHVEDVSKIQSLLKTLAKFGRIVESVDPNISFGNNAQNPADFYLLLVKILKHLPNLKELKINYYPSNLRNQRGLTRLIESNPFPKFENLEKLCINGYLPVEICTELLRQNHQFKGLKLSLDYRWSYTFDFSTNLPNLKEFDVEYILEKDFWLLKQYGRNWKLTKFRGDFKMMKEKTAVMDIFQMLGDFWGDTLEDLNISFPTNRVGSLNTEIQETIFKLTLNERFHQMKVLKTVVINIFFDGAVSLDFLLPCHSTLATIKVNRFLDARINNKPSKDLLANIAGQQVEHFDNIRDMEKSNIWTLFPKLQLYSTLNQSIKRPNDYVTI